MCIRDSYYVPGLNDRMALARELPVYNGWQIVMDDSMEPSESASTANHWMYFGRAGEGISFADQLRKLRVFESEVRRGTLIQGLMAYGAKINQPSKIRVVKTTITI